MKSRIFFLFLIVSAFLIRLYKITLVKCIAKDGIWYIRTANDFLNNKEFSATWPPLYPWFISFLLRFGISPELSGQLVSLFFGVLTVAMVYFITKFISSEKTAFIAGLFSVFHPYLVRYSAEVLADSLFMFLITACVFCGWLVMKKRKLIFAILTGFLAGLSYLTKPEGIFLLPIISIWWLFNKSLGSWQVRIGRIICAFCICFIISFPYLYTIKVETGKWMISQKQTLVFSVALQEEGIIEEFMDISPINYAKENPKSFFIKVGSGFLSLLGRIPDAYNPILFILLLIGLFYGIEDKKYLFYIITFLVPFFIGYAIYHPGRRYLVGWVPLTLYISAYGLETLKRFFKNKWLPVLIIVMFLIPKTFGYIRPESAGWKKAGLWIKDNSKNTAKVMCKNERPAFYAEREYAPWDESGFGKVDFIITDKKISFLKTAYATEEGINPVRGRSSDVTSERATSRQVGTASNGVNIYYAER